MDDKKNKKPENGRELFYVVITIAIFIVMAVGATFAFFTATASSGDNAIGTGSTTLSLDFISYENAWANDDLIPAERVVSEYSVELQDDTTLGHNTLLGNTLPNDLGAVDNNNNTLCKDDYGNSVCSVYEFQVRNPANSPQEVNIEIETGSNGFAHLRAMAYEVSVGNASTYGNITNAATAGNNGHGDPIFKADENDQTEGAITPKDGGNNAVYNETPIYVNRSGVTKTLLTYEASPEDDVPNLTPSIGLEVPTTAGGTVTVASGLTIGGGTTKSYIIVLYIQNLNSDQTSQDANRTFLGKVNVTNGAGTVGVSGAISASGGANLQGD